MLIGLMTFGAPAATVYVDQNCVNPIPPFANWATASTNIQAAVDAANQGDVILVTNGVYATGGRMTYQYQNGMYFLEGTRAWVDKQVALRSVNGPLFTVIKGFQVPVYTNGDGAIRCVYLACGASMSGFTLTNGATPAPPMSFCIGGGLVCCSTDVVVSNCVIVGNCSYGNGAGVSGGKLFNCSIENNIVSGSGGSGFGCGGGASDSILFDCLIRSNSATFYGAGIFSSAAYNCVIEENSAVLAGGGAYWGSLRNCIIRGNRSPRNEGGGVYNATLDACILSNNVSYHGGAIIGGILNNCILCNNSAVYGGGAYSGSLSNCLLIGNSASEQGGGGYQCTLSQCTLTGNSASSDGGGVYGGALNNCIVYYNSAPSGANYGNNPSFYYCCTTPAPGGNGNITHLPGLASSSHLGQDSPCVGAGSSTVASGMDIDGEPWRDPPSIGADEPYLTSGGSLSVAISAPYMLIAVRFSTPVTALIQGVATASSWDFGDGTVVSNQAYTSHVWTNPGRYKVVLKAWNADHQLGVASTNIITVVEGNYYVSPANPTPTYPYTSWATAATNIQDAIAAEPVPGRVVWVTNGVYDVGGVVINGALTNRIALTNFVRVQSVSGPSATVLKGNGPMGSNAIRCAYVGSDCVLAGFTITNGATSTNGDSVKDQRGGGVWSEASGTVSNCIIVGNVAYIGGGAAFGRVVNSKLILNYASSTGGGADNAFLDNCILAGNAAAGSGGGVSSSRLINCSLAGNTASNFGGGVYTATLINCIVYYNTARFNPDYYAAAITYSCTIPKPPGTGNITNSPLFRDTNTWSDLSLASNSFCINAGNNQNVTSAIDLAGNPRIVGGTVDMGAYESRDGATAKGIPWIWLLKYSLATDGSADVLDVDGDGANAYQEWRAGTDPISPGSVLRILSVRSTPPNFDLQWQSVTGKIYFLECCSNLGPNTHFFTIATNMIGHDGHTSYTIGSDPGLGSFFYRVGVQQ